MRILLSNDDGISAEGIQAICHQLSRLGDVYVVAPDREKSATGHCITVHCPLRVEEKPALWGAKKVWAVDGTPSDCVKLGIQALLDTPPDLVVSGINKGPNLGTDVLYSGTVSAAMEGVIEGINSIAFSLATFEHSDFLEAAMVAGKLVQQLAGQMTGKTLLNVNIPNLPSQAIKGCSITKLGLRKYKNIFDKRTDPRGKTYFWMGGEIVDLDIDDPMTDIATIQRGEISVTPLHFDLTDYKFLSSNRLEFPDFGGREDMRSR